MRWDLEKRSQASSTWNTCTSTPSFLAKKPSGEFHIVITFARVGWCSKLHPLLMLTKRWLHPLHYCFMEVHNQVRSHVCLLTRYFYPRVPWSTVVLPPYFAASECTQRSSMGMPGSETTVEILLLRPGQLHPEGMLQQSLLMSVCLKSTTIVGGIFSQGVLSASPFSYRCTHWLSSSWVCQGSTFLHWHLQGL